MNIFLQAKKKTNKQGTHTRAEIKLRNKNLPAKTTPVIYIKHTYMMPSQYEFIVKTAHQFYFLNTFGISHMLKVNNQIKAM